VKVMARPPTAAPLRWTFWVDGIPGAGAARGTTLHDDFFNYIAEWRGVGNESEFDMIVEYGVPSPWPSPLELAIGRKDL